MQLTAVVTEVLVCGVWWASVGVLAALNFACLEQLRNSTLVRVSMKAGLFSEAVVLLGVLYVLGEGGRILARWLLDWGKRPAQARAMEEGTRRLEQVCSAVGDWPKGPTASRGDHASWLGRLKRRLTSALWPGCLSQHDRALAEDEKALGEHRRALAARWDEMRTYVFVHGGENAVYDIVAHWNGMRVARNCVIPVFLTSVLGGLLWSDDLPVLVVPWVVGGLALTALLWFAFRERRGWHIKAVIREFIVLARTQVPGHECKQAPEADDCSDAPGARGD